MNGNTRRSCGFVAVVLVASLAAQAAAHAAGRAMIQSDPSKPASPPGEKPVEKPVEKPGHTPSPTPAQSPAQKPETVPPPPPTKPAESGKSLDDLLGIPSSKRPGDKPASPGDNGAAKPDDDPAAREAKERLQRGLDEKELDSLLHQALAGMRTSAEQLADRTETGLATQRVQADVVAKLDQLIEEAKRRSKNSQSKSSSGSSGSQSGQKQQQPGSAQKQGEQDGNKPGESKTRTGSQKNKAGEGNREGDGPAPVDPDKDQAAMDESQAEWGALPERVRDLIRQGSRDRIASLYQRLTQEYYRRMAEDASR